MRIFFGLCGIVLSFLMIKYRERVGDIFGESSFVHDWGGVYNLIILLAVFIFLWSVAALTNTLDIFLWPVFLIPGLSRPGPPPPTPSF